MIDLPDNPYAVGALTRVDGSVCDPRTLMPEVGAALAVAYELSITNEQLERIAQALEVRDS